MATILPFDELNVSKNIDKYQVKEVDMGKIDDAPFNYVVSFGIFSKASYNENLRSLCGISTSIIPLIIL